jgi:hypothetical protein
VLKGKSPPFKVVVRDSSGRPEGSARVLKPTQIALFVRSDLEEVTVEATDATGQMLKTTASKSKPQADLDLGD